MKNLGLLVAWVIFGVAVYFGLFFLKSGVGATASNPVSTRPMIAIPGTVYVAQHGALYRIDHSQIVRIRAGSDPWSQPSVMPDGRLLAVVRHANASDIWVLSNDGTPVQQVTHNQAASVEENHWAFYPHLAADGKNVLFDYDPKDPGNQYRVDLAVYSVGLAPRSGTRELTYPNFFTGGDVNPVPLADGGFLFTRYSISNNEAHSVIFHVARPGYDGVALTGTDEDCAQPSVSPDGTRMAMVCAHGKQEASLEMARWDGKALGPRAVMLAGELAADPVWAPDSSGILYLAPAGRNGGFQLWWLSLTPGLMPGGSAAPTPTDAPSPGASPDAPSPLAANGSRPVQVTADLDLDANSPPAWISAP